MKLSHLDEASRARMVDVGGKPETERTAVAEGLVRMSREAFDQVAAHTVAKGDVLAVAEVAGVMAAKRTGELIPLCHPLGLDVVTVEARLVPEAPRWGRPATRASTSSRRSRGGPGPSAARWWSGAGCPSRRAWVATDRVGRRSTGTRGCSPASTTGS